MTTIIKLTEKQKIKAIQDFTTYISQNEFFAFKNWKDEILIRYFIEVKK